GSSPAEVHGWFAVRAQQWPHAMSATSTHDTKRSEDARVRLLALTEFPEEWARFVTAARRLNRRHRRQVTGELHPDGLTEYYLYQTLVASWTDDQETGEYADRI